MKQLNINTIFLQSIRSASFYQVLIFILIQDKTSFFPLACLIALWQSAQIFFNAQAKLNRSHELLATCEEQIKQQRSQVRTQLEKQYLEKGIDPSILSTVIDNLMANPQRLTLVMMQEKQALYQAPHPLLQSLVTFVSSLFIALLLTLYSLTPSSYFHPIFLSILLAYISQMALNTNHNSKSSMALYCMGFSILLWQLFTLFQAL